MSRFYRDGSFSPSRDWEEIRVLQPRKSLGGSTQFLVTPNRKQSRGPKPWLSDLVRSLPSDPHPVTILQQWLPQATVTADWLTATRSFGEAQIRDQYYVHQRRKTSS